MSQIESLICFAFSVHQKYWIQSQMKAKINFQFSTAFDASAYNLIKYRRATTATEILERQAMWWFWWCAFARTCGFGMFLPLLFKSNNSNYCYLSHRTQIYFRRLVNLIWMPLGIIFSLNSQTHLDFIRSRSDLPSPYGVVEAGKKLHLGFNFFIEKKKNYSKSLLFVEN